MAKSTSKPASGSAAERLVNEVNAQAQAQAQSEEQYKTKSALFYLTPEAHAILNDLRRRTCLPKSQLVINALKHYYGSDNDLNADKIRRIRDILNEE